MPTSLFPPEDTFATEDITTSAAIAVKGKIFTVGTAPYPIQIHAKILVAQP
jgi:hypothetical protein